jgi:hypothetical protein
MSNEGLKALIARANNDKDFLRRLLISPEEAVKTAGYDLTDQEIDIIKTSQGHGKLTDEELEKRVSKGFFRLGP